MRGEKMRSTRAGVVKAGLLCLITVFTGSAWGQGAGFDAGQSLDVDDILSEARAIRVPDVPPAGKPALAGLDEQASIVAGISLEFYQALRILSHAAIRIVDEDGAFWQIELQDKNEYSRIKEPRFYNYGIKGTLMGYSVSSMGDIVLYTDADERKSLEQWNPHLSSMPVCLDGAMPRRSFAWYKNCLDGKAKVYTEKAFKYGYLSNNCSHLAATLLNKCGLTNCRDYPKSSGLFHRKGMLNLPPASGKEESN
ncbi:MAG: hypothetical protein AAB320_11240 [Elusimicrobiota bacterium]